MDRTNFYHVEVVDKVNELDFLHNALSEFTMVYPPSYYRVNGTDLMRPDIISYKFYDTVRFWWIIMLVNGIDNPLTSIEVGQILKIPSKLDIYDFEKKFRVRRSS